jgi:peptidoglycan/LPS O-acetylase OafA/YrhL
MDQSAAANKNRFTVLDSFRGIFALCVVMFHMHYLNSITELSFFRGSALFVDFFFVLSGFVITHSYAFKKDLSFGRFTLSRFFRLFPLHIATLLFFILLELVKLVAFSHGITLNKPPFSADNDPSQIVPNLFLLQSWTTYTTGLSFNYPAWSISIEFYMYLIFYTILLFKGLFRYMLWFFIATIATWLFINNYLTTENILSSSVLRGLSGFFTGALTYILYIKTHKIVKLNALLSSIIELLLFISLLLTISFDFSSKGVVLILLFSTSIFIFAHERGVISTFLSKKFFTFIGKLSYSIYMTHASLLVTILYIYMTLEKIISMNPITTLADGAKAFDLGNSFINNFAILLVLISVLLISSLTYKYIEMPSQRLGRKFIDKFALAKHP